MEELEKYLADERARAAQLPQLNSQLEHLKALVATMKKDARFRQGMHASTLHAFEFSLILFVCACC